MKEQNIRLITKYALILSVSSVASFTFSRLIVSSAEVADRIDLSTRSFLPLAFSLVLNLITAFIVDHDIKKYGVRTKFVILSTILYRPIGVVAFLLFKLLQSESTIAGTLERQEL